MSIPFLNHTHTHTCTSVTFYPSLSVCVCVCGCGDRLSAELSSLTTESQLQDFSARLLDRQVALLETMSVISRQLPVLQSLSMQTQQSIHEVRAEEGRAAGQGQPTD